MMHLSEQEERALVMFKDKLLRLFPDRVDDLKLYGSKARGDGSKYSDVDVLVVLRGERWQDSGPVHRAASEVSLETGTDLSVKILSPDGVRRLRERGSSFMANVDRDGVEI